MFKQRAATAQRHFHYGILGLFFLNLMLFGDILFNGKGRILSSNQADLFLHFAAWRQFAFDQLRQGHLVLWNPHYLCGTPFLGNFESALLYPLNWLYLVLPLPLAINLGIVLHVFLAGLWMYLWAHHRGLAPLACFTAGCAFMLGGSFYLHLFAGHLPNLCAMVWAPLLFLAIDGLVEEGSAGWILLGVFAISMQITAGHPQYVYFTGIAAGIYVLLNLKGHNRKSSIVAGFLGFYLGASLVTAVQLWTGIQAFLECARHNPLEFIKASSFSFPPQNILTMVLPDFFGNLTDSPYWSQWFLWEVSLFVGLGIVFLAFTAVFKVDPSRRKWALTMASAVFLLSLGSFTPLYRFIYDCLPLFSGLRGICKFDFLVGMFLALLGGMGMNYWMDPKTQTMESFRALAGAGLLFFTAEIWIMNSLDQGLEGAWAKWFSNLGWLKKSFLNMGIPQQEQLSRETGLRAALSLWIGGCTCLLLSFLVLIQRARRTMLCLLTGLIIVELFSFARANRPSFEWANLQKKYDQIQQIYRRDPGDYRVYGTGSASLVTGGFDLWEDEPMVLGRYGRFVCYSQGLLENQLFSVLPIYQRFHPVFGMMRLKYRVFMDHEPVDALSLGFKVLPRMLLLNKWEVFSDGGRILPALFESSFDPAQKVFLEKQPNPPPMEGGRPGSVQWKDLSTDEMEVRADVPQASLLLVTDNYSQGWRGLALPDSAQTRYEVMPANYFLKAIPLSAGKHHFILRYRPLAFVMGKWVSLFSCLIYVGMIIYYFRKKVLAP